MCSLHDYPMFWRHSWNMAFIILFFLCILEWIPNMTTWCWFVFICFSFPTCTGPKSFSVLLRAAWWRITHSVLQQSSSWSTRLSEISPTRGKCAFSSKTTLTAPRRRGERRVCRFSCLPVTLPKWICLQEYMRLIFRKDFKKLFQGLRVQLSCAKPFYTAIYTLFRYSQLSFNIRSTIRSTTINCVIDTKASESSVLLFAQMKQSMNTVAVKKRKKILQSRRESPGIV